VGPAAGGVQGSFGSMAKSLQVGMAAEAGVRAARLVADGASVNRAAFDEWFALMGGRRDALDVDVIGPAVPDGLAIKIFPCCYAMQRPISAIASLSEHRIDPASVTRIDIVTPEACVKPLIHHEPTTGLAAKFSMEYAAAAALLDGRPGPDSFTDEAATRPEARRLVDCVHLDTPAGGDNLLSGKVEITVTTSDGVYTAVLDSPPGAPDRPPSVEDMTAKMDDCGKDVRDLVLGVGWSDAADMLRAELVDVRR
jgi:2-methylcitrate dehydratase PrpD